MTTKVPVELSSTPGIVDGSNATAITIDSSENVGIGVTPDSEPRLHVHKASAGSVASATNSVLTLENSTTAILQFLTPNSASAQIRFGDPEDTGAGYIQYGHSDNSLQFSANGPEKMRINSSGYVGIGTSSPATGLSLVGANNAASTLTLTNTAPSPDNTWTFTPQYNSGSLTISDDGTQRMEINSAGQITMGSTSHADDILYLTRSGHNKMLRFYSGANESGWIGSYTTGALMIGSGDVALTFRTDSDSIYPVTDQVSGRDNAVDLGHPSVRFDDIYATNGTIQTSDRNEKNTITDSDLGLDFVKKLTPKSYKYNGKTRTHYGLVAQDVETVLSDISKPTENFAGFIKSDTSEEGDGSSYRYGLRYHEFIAPMLKAIQELSTELETAKARIKTLEDA